MLDGEKGWGRISECRIICCASGTPWDGPPQGEAICTSPCAGILDAFEEKNEQAGQSVGICGGGFQVRVDLCSAYSVCVLSPARGQYIKQSAQKAFPHSGGRAFFLRFIRSPF